MHSSALSTMAALLRRAPDGTKKVLDVGSLDVNGTYRPMIEDVLHWEYTGLDIQGGPNVDVISEPTVYPFEDNTFDVVMSGSTLEHVEKPWLVIPEMARILKPGGLLAVLTHWKFPFHEYPKDCFRFMPDGMRSLFDEAKCLERYEIAIVDDQDIFGTALKSLEY